MFARLKKKNLYREAAQGVYAQLLERSRDPRFYASSGVPDTFIGRFDLLLLHVFLVVNRLTSEGAAGQGFSQALFDITFTHMDQGLRELGMGDMGVPKRMRKMMKAFNGRMHAYRDSLGSDADLKDALRRNLYGSVETPEAGNMETMKNYVRANINILANQSLTDMLEGRMVLREISQD